MSEKLKELQLSIEKLVRTFEYETDFEVMCIVKDHMNGNIHVSIRAK